VVHVEAFIALDILGPSGFADPNMPHPGCAWPVERSPTSSPTWRRWPGAS
jgi:hypothetical protein